MAGETAGRDRSAEAGQAIYKRFALHLYDRIVFGHNLPVLWRCPKEHLMRLYDQNARERHLDIGVGTGYLIDRCRFPCEAPQITLMDMSPGSLAFASRRLRRYSPETHRTNVLEPWGLAEGGFDSVAMVNLLHCVPGTLPEKAIVFDYANDALAPGGTLFGATVLGLEADHTKRSRKALARFNRRGVFSNLEDRREDLERSLAERFTTHEVEVQGAMALFAARQVAQ